MWALLSHTHNMCNNESRSNLIPMCHHGQWGIGMGSNSPPGTPSNTFWHRLSCQVGHLVFCTSCVISCMSGWPELRAVWTHYIVLCRRGVGTYIWHSGGVASLFWVCRMSSLMSQCTRAINIYYYDGGMMGEGIMSSGEDICFPVFGTWCRWQYSWNMRTTMSSMLSRSWYVWWLLLGILGSYGPWWTYIVPPPDSASILWEPPL